MSARRVRSLFVAISSVMTSVAVAQAQNDEPPPDDRGEGAVPRGGAGAAVRPADPGAPAKGPTTILPKIIHFEHAPYPPEAFKAGIQADVILKLTINAAGEVTAAEVTQPAGHGFDEAAQAAALKFKFEPATRDGKPFAVKIPWKYSFTLSPAKSAAARPPAPPKTGNLSGQIRMADSNMPLAGVEVVVTAQNGVEYRALTDGDGRWQFTALPPGRYQVKIASEGFDAREETEEVSAGEATEVTYRLAPESEGIEVTVQGERPPREVTKRTIERREIDRIPGTSGDALRSIQSLPGVARPPGLAGLLIVRGSSPNDTETFVDGAGVPLIYHFGGLSSVVPTELLDRIDFYPGNFSARYGRVMGGIVDVGLRSPDTRCFADYMVPTDENGCYHGILQADLIDGRFLLQGPIGPSKDWTFAVGGRRSWVDAWLTPVLEEAGSSVTSAPVYYDYQVIAEHKPTPDSKLSLRVFGADDRLEILIRDPAAQDPAFGGNVNFGANFITAQALYQGKLNADVELNAMLAAGRNGFDFSLGPFLFDFKIYPILARSEFGWSLGKGVKLNAGMDMVVAPFDVLVIAPPPPRAGEPDPGPFAARPSLRSQETGTAFRPAWYTELELQPTRRLRIVPGARLDYARDSGHADFSPRLNARYDLVPASDSDAPGAPRNRRTTLKGGIGVFHQPPQFQETDEIFGTPNLGSNRSIHYSIGVEQEFTQQVEVSAEGFYKDMTELVSRNDSASGGFDYNNEGTGYVFGLETLLKYKPDKRFFGWIAYTLSRSIRKDGPDEEAYLFQYDQTHNLTVLGSYRLGRGWEFGARFRLISGSLETPVLGPPGLPALYASDAGAYAALPGKPFSERLPLFHQLDLRVDKRWQFKSWRLSAYLDLQNAYNNAAAEGIAYNYNFSQRTYQYGLPLIPSVGLRGEF